MVSCPSPQGLLLALVGLSGCVTDATLDKWFGGDDEETVQVDSLDTDASETGALGACCVGWTGTCVDGVESPVGGEGEGEAEALGCSVWDAGYSCSEISSSCPEEGACCIRGSCSVTSKDDCSEGGGVYWGAQSTCEEAECTGGRDSGGSSR